MVIKIGDIQYSVSRILGLLELLYVYLIVSNKKLCAYEYAHFRGKEFMAYISVSKEYVTYRRFRTLRSTW